MTNKELKTKVAEFAKWRKTEWKQPCTNAELWTDDVPSNGPHGVRCYTFDHLPDYPTDLNAMHEAEETLNPLQRYRYGQVLERVVENPHERHFATARQRAEAFVKTMSKSS